VNCLRGGECLQPSSLEQLSLIRTAIKNNVERGGAVHPKALEPDVVNIFGAAARYRRATVGSSHDDAHPDNSTLHTNKFILFRCKSSELFFSCCDRQRRGATDNDLGTTINYLRQQRAAPRASA
jgi:hypothetical protein